MRTQNDSPCAPDCPDRSPHCHASCEKYAAFAEQRKEKRTATWHESIWTSAKTGAYCKGAKYRPKKVRKPV